MIELHNDALTFSFPEVHADANLTIGFQRTLRIPDDGAVHYLPPGLGQFPLRHVDDHGSRIPRSWQDHGGVMLPMFQSEAMWINFSSRSNYPFLVKIATGKINAVTGKEWQEGIGSDSQDYLVVPVQPWLDGFCVANGEIRQFVAMPLGLGYSTEEQLTGAADVGGVQILVRPMKAGAWAKLAKRAEYRRDLCYCLCESPREEMGLAPGGRMRQTIHEDPYGADKWSRRCSSRCFVHIANSLHWRAITGEAPPTIPPTASSYAAAGLPWFDHYNESVEAVDGSPVLAGVQSVAAMGKEKGETPLPENESIVVNPKSVVHIGPNRRGAVVREYTAG